MDVRKREGRVKGGDGLEEGGQEKKTAVLTKENIKWGSQCLQCILNGNMPGSGSVHTQALLCLERGPKS